MGIGNTTAAAALVAADLTLAAARADTDEKMTRNGRMGLR